MTNLRKHLLLIFIAATAAFLRFYNLGSVPASMNADEAAIGYNAYSLLKTGKDEYGQILPLAFRSFDDYKAPLYVYLTVVSESVFGLCNFAVRFPSTLLGTMTVILTYLLVQAMIRSEKSGFKHSEQLALLSALLLAISPWHLHFSRSAYEANVSVFFITAGLYLFFLGLVNPKVFIFSGISMALAMWTYHTARVFVPLAGLALIIIFIKKILKIKKAVFFGLLTYLILIIPLIWITFSPTGLVRAKGVSSLERPEILQRSVEWMVDDNSNLLSKIFHNRRVEYTREIIKGYLSHYDPEFLFGERAQSKYRAPGMGLMYLWELPVLIAGLYNLARINSQWSTLLLTIIVLAPVAAAPTLWLPHPVRTIVFLPVLQIAVASGIFFLINRIRFLKKIFIFTVLFVMLSSLSYYLHQYYKHMPVDFASDWQYGRQQVVEEVKKLENNYDQIIVSTTLDQPQIFFLYYQKYDPVKYLEQGGTISGKFDTQANSYGKYLFKSIPDNRDKNIRILYVGVLEEKPNDAEIIKTVNYPDGQVAFVLFE